MQLKVKRLDDRARLPEYATEGAACFDITAINKTPEGPTRASFGTGLAFEVPKDHVMLVFSRSGHGFRDNTRLANCVGVVDSDYRGELFVKLDRSDGMMIDALPGDRIAQAMVIPVSRVSLVEVEELTETKRGANGLGSTGRK